MKNTITGPPSSAKLFVLKYAPPQTVNLRRISTNLQNEYKWDPWGTDVVLAKDPPTLKSVSWKRRYSESLGVLSSMYAYLHYEDKCALYSDLGWPIPYWSRKLLWNPRNYGKSALSIFGSPKYGKWINARFHFLFLTLLRISHVRANKNKFIPESVVIAEPNLRIVLLSIGSDQPSHSVQF